jgi:WhiB family redox-sensing transcriptional regulator
MAAENSRAANVGKLFGGTCRDADPELFFPIGSSGRALRQIAEAKAICAHCRLQPECLGYALATGQDAGIWGGTTVEERRAFRVSVEWAR